MEGRLDGLVGGLSPSVASLCGWPSCVVILGVAPSRGTVVPRCGGRACCPDLRPQPFGHPLVRLAVAESVRLALSLTGNWQFRSNNLSEDSPKFPELSPEPKPAVLVRIW